MWWVFGVSSMRQECFQHRKLIWVDIKWNHMKCLIKNKEGENKMENKLNTKLQQIENSYEAW